MRTSQISCSPEAHGLLGEQVSSENVGEGIEEGEIL